MNIIVSSEGNQVRKPARAGKYKRVALVRTLTPPRGRITGQAGSLDLDSIEIPQAGAVQLMGSMT